LLKQIIYLIKNNSVLYDKIIICYIFDKIQRYRECKNYKKNCRWLFFISLKIVSVIAKMFSQSRGKKTQKRYIAVMLRAKRSYNVTKLTSKAKNSQRDSNNIHNDRQLCKLCESFPRLTILKCNIFFHIFTR